MGLDEAAVAFQACGGTRVDDLGSSRGGASYRVGGGGRGRHLWGTETSAARQAEGDGGSADTDGGGGGIHVGYEREEGDRADRDGPPIGD